MCVSLYLCIQRSPHHTILYIQHMTDPIHEATNVGKSTKYLAQESIEAKAAFEMPDFTAIGEEISAAFGKLFSKK